MFQTSPITPFEVTLVALAVAVAIFTDLRERKVYNSLTAPLAIGGILHSAWAGGTTGLGQSLLGLVVGLVVLLIPFAMGLLGGGDVKLVAAMGAWLGYQNIILIILISCLLNGLVAVGLLFARGGVASVAENLQMSRVRLVSWYAAPHVEESDTIATRASDPSERKQLIPFTLLIGFAVVITVYLQR